MECESSSSWEKGTPSRMEEVREGSWVCLVQLVKSGGQEAPTGKWEELQADACALTHRRVCPAGERQRGGQERGLVVGPQQLSRRKRLVTVKQR